MRLECASSGPYHNATPSDIEHVFADDLARGEFAILIADDGSIIQAAGEMDDPHTLQYADALCDKQFEAIQKCMKEQVRLAFLSFLNGDRAWYEAHEWRELKPTGCRKTAAAGAMLFLVTSGALAYSLA
jgi:hypothetical protein